MDLSTDLEENSTISVANRPQQAYFQFQKQRDGTLLTVSHTVEEDSKIIRIRFIDCFFSENNRHFILLDHRYHIFIFDLTRRKFWKFPQKLPHCSVIKNIPQKPLEFVAATKDGQLIFFNLEKSETTKCCTVSQSPVLGLSFSTTMSDAKKSDTVLAYTANELMLICLSSMVPKFEWKCDGNNFSIRYVAFVPNTNKFFACLSNDAVYIWSDLSNSPSRVVNPIRLRSRYKQDDIVKASLPEDDCMETAFDPLALTSNGVIRFHRLSADGKTLCLTTTDGDIILLSTANFEIAKIVHLNNVVCKRAEMFAHSSNNQMYVQTHENDLLLVNCKKTDVNVVIQISNVHRIQLASNGKLVGVVLKTGEVKLCRTSAGCSVLSKVENIVQETKRPKIGFESGAGCFNDELHQLLPKNRLAAILKEYGEYPEKHRHLIWCSLLKLPNNRKTFQELLRRELHPAVGQYGQIYPLKDAAVLRNLQRTMSSLIHWCPAFAFSRFLPNFVFPFLKIFPHSPMLTFELIITILLNHCQLWFEFSPMEPLNYLGMVENILHEFCPKLMKFYKEYDVTANIYAWPLLSTAFSEVLDTQQWYQLWDNILSSQPEFLLFCVVAYNIVLKSTVMSLNSAPSVQSFFRDQNIIDVKRLIRCASLLMKSCPDSLRPGRYIHGFEKLPLGYYPKFEKYPKEMIETKVKEIDNLRQQSASLDRQLEKMAKVENDLVKQLEEKLKEDAHRNRLKDVENLYGEAISREIQRIRYQEKMLLLYKRQMRTQEVQMTQLINQNALKNDVDSRMYELDTLMNRIEKTRAHQEMQLLFADDELYDDKLKNALQKNQVAVDSLHKEPLELRFNRSIEKLKNTEKSLSNEVNKILSKNVHKRDNRRSHSAIGALCNIESDLMQIEKEFVRTIRSQK